MTVMGSDELILNASRISHAASESLGGGASLRARETHRASERSDDTACLADASLWFCNSPVNLRVLSSSLLCAPPHLISHDDVNVCLRVRVIV